MLNVRGLSDHGEISSISVLQPLFLYVEDGCGDVWCTEVWELKVICYLPGSRLKASSFYLKGSTYTAKQVLNLATRSITES